MEMFEANPTHVRILVLADVCNESVAQVAEHFIPTSPQFDAVVVCGPFCFVQSQDAATAEERVLIQGEIGSVLAQLENIVCRVMYLGAHGDPPAAITDQLHLTPNSVNINQRVLPLADDLFIMGFTETQANLTTSGLPPDNDRSCESDDELEGVEVKSGTTSVKTIEDLLQASCKNTQGHGIGSGTFSEESQTVFANAHTPDKKSAGIFALNYKFSHTLNHFLFHMPEAIENAGIKICIIPPTAGTAEPARLPTKFGNIFIAALGSLRLKGSYTIIELAKRDGEWVPSIEAKTVPSSRTR